MKSPINLTSKAAQHIKGVLSKHSPSALMRIAIKPTGCSGYKYDFEATSSIVAKDSVFESGGVKLVIDSDSLKYLSGCELDFVREGINTGLKFSNPNVQETCGCGESFSLREKAGN